LPFALVLPDNHILLDVRHLKPDFDLVGTGVDDDILKVARLEAVGLDVEPVTSGRETVEDGRPALVGREHLILLPLGLDSHL
jgi:hypothetical protein